MKKILLILISFMTLLTLVACGSTDEVTSDNEDSEEPEEIVGGYEEISPVVDDSTIELVNKATSELLGATYTPIANVATQIVSGTNHLILCTITTSSETPVSTYALVTIYEDLQGNAEVTAIQNSLAEDETGKGLLSGWQLPESVVVTEEVNEALDKAQEELTGASYEAVATLASQVVEGTNYCLLCKVTIVTEDPSEEYKIVYLNVDLDGNATITSVVDFDEAE